MKKSNKAREDYIAQGHELSDLDFETDDMI